MNTTIKQKFEEMPNAIRKEIDELEDDNNHTESMLVLARYLGDVEAALKFEVIIDLHNLIGHMPYELSNERYGVYVKMIGRE